MKIWGQLCNEYILPLYGVYKDDGPIPYLVSPWCSNGNACRYLRDKSPAERLKVCLDAAYGLRYLHSLEQPVIHSDLRGSSILISDDGTALLTGFKISKTDGVFTQSNGVPSLYRWMAPEIQNGELMTASDIWSWGMTTLELVTGKVPYSSVRLPGRVLLKVIRGERPNPKDYDTPALNGELWSLLEECWNMKPEKRPDINAVVKKMETILAAYSPKSCSPTADSPTGVESPAMEDLPIPGNPTPEVATEEISTEEVPEAQSSIVTGPTAESPIAKGPVLVNSAVEGPLVKSPLANGSVVEEPMMVGPTVTHNLPLQMDQSPTWEFEIIVSRFLIFSYLLYQLYLYFV